METFRQYAVVSNVLIMRDWATGLSRGIAFVEFQTVEHATHARNLSSQLVIAKHQLKVGYARPGYMKFFQAQVSFYFAFMLLML
jgi:RNA recognition motif-containing protein